MTFSTYAHIHTQTHTPSHCTQFIYNNMHRYFVEKLRNNSLQSENIWWGMSSPVFCIALVTHIALITLF